MECKMGVWHKERPSPAWGGIIFLILILVSSCVGAGKLAPNITKTAILDKPVATETAKINLSNYLDPNKAKTNSLEISIPAKLIAGESIDVTETKKTGALSKEEPKEEPKKNKELEESVIHAHLDKADAFIEQGDPNSALRECNLLLEKLPLHPRLNATLAWIYIKKNNPSEAKKFIQIALLHNFDESQEPHYWLILAISNYLLDQKKEAKKILDLATENLPPTSAKYQKILRIGGVLCEKFGYPSKAYNLLKKFFQLNTPETHPKSFELYTKLSISEGTESEQMAIIQSHVDLPEEKKTSAQKRRKVIQWYIDSMIDSSDYDYIKVAEMVYEHLLIDTPEWEDISLYRDTQQYIEDKSLYLFELNVLINKYPEILDFRIQLAELFKKLDEIKKARMEYETILLKNPKHYTGLLSLGELEYETGNFEEAVRHFNKAIKFSPTNEDAFCNLAKAYEGKLDLNNALVTWQRVKTIAHTKFYAEDKSRLQAFVLDDKLRDLIIEADERMKMIKAYKPILPKLKQAINKIIVVLTKYNMAGEKRISGRDETKPNYEKSTYSGEKYITSYNVAPDIYVAEQLYRDCAKEASKIIKIPEVTNIRNLIIEAAHRAAEGIALSAQGYYVSKEDYSGQFEKGYALIISSTQKIFDVYDLLIPLVNRHFLDFTEDIREKIKLRGL